MILKNIKFIFFVIILLFLFSNNVLANNISKGFINLERSLDQIKEVELKGEWEFYWNKLLLPKNIENNNYTYQKFPNDWRNIKIENKNLPSFGYATYRLNIKLKDKDKIIGFEIPDFYSNYRLFINGELFSENGEVSDNIHNNKPYWLPKTKGYYLRDNNIELVLQISNFYHSKGGSYRKPIIIGNYDYLKNKRELQTSQVFFLTGVLLVGALFFLALFLITRNDKSILFFSLFCIAYSYRIIGTELYLINHLFPYLSWFISIKMEYISLFLSNLFFTLFSYSLYKEDSNKIIFKFLLYISILFSLFTLFTEPYFFTKSINIFTYILMISFTYHFYLFMKAFINKRYAAIYSLLNLLLISFAFIINLVSYSFLKTPTFYLNLTFLVHILFFFLNSLIISQIFYYFLSKAKEDAEQGLRSRAEFISMMSHEIRTPLNGIIGMTDLLLKDSLLNKNQRENIEIIKVSSNSLLNIVNDILDFSKLEANKFKINYEKTNILEIIEEVIETFSYNCSEKNIYLISYIDENIPENLFIDKKALKQILINLISNAYKFTNKGHIFVKVNVINKNNNDLYINFLVQDTGIGIPEDKEKLLFKPFSQIDSSNSRKYSGTGIGLLICKYIVELMGGEIQYSKNKFQGADFEFSIKVDKNSDKLIYSSKIEKSAALYYEFKNKEDYSEKLFYEILERKLRNIFVNFEIIDNLNTKYDFIFTNKNELKSLKNAYIISSIQEKDTFDKYILNTVKISNLRNLDNKSIQKIYNELNDYKILNILFAEDNIVNQKLLNKIAEKLNLNYEIVSNGIEVLKKIAEKNIDIIFMDIQMPELDGLETTKKIREKYKNKPFIIALTANASEEDKKNCLSSGMNYYLSKPVKIDHIIKSLDYYLSSLN